MKTLKLTDSQYSDLLHCIDWGIDAAEGDMGDVDHEQPNIFGDLKEVIVAQGGTE